MHCIRCNLQRWFAFTYLHLYPCTAENVFDYNVALLDDDAIETDASTAAIVDVAGEVKVEDIIEDDKKFDESSAGEMQVLG